MGAIITVANHKGGVGKSALVKNLSSYMTKFYKNILVLDFDPQAPDPVDELAARRAVRSA